MGGYLRRRRLTLADATRTEARTTGQPKENGARAARPCNARAERGLLGLTLVSRGACDVAVTVPVAAYADPKHGHVAEAVVSLHLSGAAVDPLTVGEILRAKGVLEDVGGHQALVDLQKAALGYSAAPTYAGIIMDCWHQWLRIGYTAELHDAALKGHDLTEGLAKLADVEATAGADELELDDLAAALDHDLDEEPTVLTRSDGRHLLYEAAVNMLQSEPTVGKSWIALIAAAELVRADAHVLYLDYEDNARRIARRMVDNLDVERATLIERFHYKRLHHLSPGALVSLPRKARECEARLVVVDGMATALASQGYDENVAGEVAKWWTSVAVPLAETGACVLILDHVTKSKEGRGRWARGSGHKLAAVDGAAYGLETVEPLSRRRKGRLKLVVAKDRPGVVGAVGETAAEVTLDPLERDGQITWRTVPVAEWEGPTDCMALVRRLFTEHPELELPRSSVAGHIKTIYNQGFRDRTVREAADRLALDGVLTTRSGGRSTYFRLTDDRKDPDNPAMWEEF